MDLYTYMDYMGVSENSVPLNPMVLLIIIPIKWLFHWEYTQHFQTNPYWIINHGSQVGPDRSVAVPFLFEPSHTDTDNRRSVGSFRRPAVDSSGSWDCSHPSEVPSPRM